MPAYFIASLLRLLVGLLTRSVDVVHINMAERLSVWRKMSIGRLAQSFGVPVILHMHGADFVEYHQGLGRRRRHLLDGFVRSCDRVLVLGTYWRQFVEEKIGVVSASIIILYNAAPTPAQLVERDPSTCRFLFLGVIGERKGVGTLIQALSGISALSGNQSSGFSWSAVVAGDGDIETYQSLTSRLGLSKQVRFPGLLSEEAARTELATADVLVLPSRNEGLPMAILEAMSFGCAIVATPVGSIAEAVVSGKTGLLTPVGDVPALQDALDRLARDPLLRSQLGANSRTRFEQLFSLTSFVEKLEAIYKTCRSGQPSR